MRSWLAPVVSVGLMFCFTARLQGQANSRSVSEHFLIDHNRIFVELEFVRPDASIRKTLAFVDSGDPNFEFTAALARELGLDRGNPIRVRFAGMDLNASPKIQASTDEGKTIFAGMVVEANLPSTVLDQYDVVLDYGNRTLTLAPPGSLKHEGTRIPCKVNPKTGLISVEGEIGRQSYAVAIDAGSAYTWIDQAVAKKWITAHPQWVRGVGAVGDANMNGALPELTGTILRLPVIHLGAFAFEQVGALAVSGGWDKAGPNLFQWYSQKTPEPVAGFIGGNILRQFRVEIDYAHHATYWKRIAPPDPSDLDQVGITIGVHGGKYSVIALPTQNGKVTVHGIAVNDQLLSVDGVAVTGATMGKVLTALHGRPGEIRRLVFERNGKSFSVDAPITSF
jgi:hypothetical protein